MDRKGLTRILERQKGELAQGEDALAAAAATLLAEMGKVGQAYARTRLTEFLIDLDAAREGQEAGSPGQPHPSQDVARVLSDLDLLAHDTRPPPAIMLGVAVPSDRLDEARRVVNEAKGLSASGDPAGMAYYDHKEGEDLWVRDLFRAAYEDSLVPEAERISQVLSDLIADTTRAAPAPEPSPREMVLGYLLRAPGPVRPAEIATALNLRRHALGPILGSLARGGEAERLPDGAYKAA